MYGVYYGPQSSLTYRIIQDSVSEGALYLRHERDL
jgi:hypothetical protein